MDNYKKFLPYAVNLFLIFFNFLFLSIPYFNTKLFVLSGYSCLSLWSYGWSGILLSVFQLLSLIAMVVMIFIAIIGIFIEFARLLNANKNVYFNKPNKIIAIINLSLDGLVLIFLIIFIGIHGYTLNAGLFLKIFFDVVGLIVVMILDFKYNNRVKEIFKPIEDNDKNLAIKNFLADNN